MNFLNISSYTRLISCRLQGTCKCYGTCTVPLTSNLTRSCESLASRSRVQLLALTRRIGYTRENTGLHSREHWATLARTLGYTRENTGLHSRQHWATLARTLGYTREATWLHSRATHARPLGYSNTREATWLARLHSRGHCIDEADIIMGATRHLP